MTTERERFEAWAKTTHPRWRFDKSRSDDGYMYAPTATAWRAWQAALSAPPGTENRRAQPAAPADAAPSVAPEPVAWMWQHDETGRTGFVGSGFDRAHWEEHNPRLKIIAPCFVHPPRAPLTREALAEIVRSHLTATYHCTRVWGAWHVGTMTEDDFEPASESDMAEDIADAILANRTTFAAPSVAPEPVAWEGGEEWESLAWELCADENGEDACNELIWEGGPIPEPWGDRWMKYEGEAKRLIALVHKHAAHPPRAPLTDAEIDAMWQVAYPDLCDEPRCSFDWFEAGVRALEARISAHGIGGN